MESNNILYIKRILNDSYAKKDSLLFEIAEEISTNILNCSLKGISQYSDGIHLEFECTSMTLDKSDISKAVAHSIRNILIQYEEKKSEYNEEVVNFLNDEVNMYGFFNVMMVRGMFFTIIL